MRTLFLLLFLLTSCLPKAQTLLQLPSGETFPVRLADTHQKQVRGLSGVKAHDFGPQEGMLFLYGTGQRRGFWMPDTWFNLDIFFLDEHLTVTALERGLPHHPGRKTPPPIARTRRYFCHHALEVKSGTPLAAKIVVGTRFKALFDHPLLQKGSKTRRER